MLLTKSEDFSPQTIEGDDRGIKRIREEMKGRGKVEGFRIVLRSSGWKKIWRLEKVVLDDRIPSKYGEQGPHVLALLTRIELDRELGLPIVTVLNLTFLENKNYSGMISSREKMPGGGLRLNHDPFTEHVTIGHTALSDDYL